MGLWYYLHLFSWCVPSHRLMVKKITYKYSGLGSSSRIPLVPSNHPDFSQWLHLVHGLGGAGAVHFRRTHPNLVRYAYLIGAYSSTSKVRDRKKK